MKKTEKKAIQNLTDKLLKSSVKIKGGGFVTISQSMGSHARAGS